MSTQYTLAALNGLIGLSAMGAAIGGLNNGATKLKDTTDKTIDMGRRLLLAESFFLIGASLAGALPGRVGSNINAIALPVALFTVASIMYCAIRYPLELEGKK